VFAGCSSFFAWRPALRAARARSSAAVYESSATISVDPGLLGVVLFWAG
jgi:hypothetical protein